MKRDCPPDAAARAAAFTIVELLVAMTLLTVIAMMLASMTGSTATIWRRTASRVEQFRSAGNGFEAITRRLSQATLNTYWDYDNIATPTKYNRQSEMRFISGPAETLLGTGVRRPTHATFFQAPLGYVDDFEKFGGLSNLMNTWGFYVEFNEDPNRPTFLNNVSPPPPKRFRYRLMEYMQPSNFLNLYSLTSGKPTYAGTDWFTKPLQKTPKQAHVLSENVIALLLLPRLARAEDLSGTALAPDYAYDSTLTKTGQNNPKNQLPPVVQVTMVAIDEVSAERLIRSSAVPAFDTVLGHFTQANQLDANLAELEKTLVANHASYRVFTSAVSLRGSKWSRY